MVGPEVSKSLPYYPNLKLTIHQVVGMMAVVSVSYMHNVVSKRPMRASSLRHIAAAAFGYYLGDSLEKFRERKRCEKVAVIEDYIRLHPEDFPEVTPQKYKDVLLPWTPWR